MKKESGYSARGWTAILLSGTVLGLLYALLAWQSQFHKMFDSNVWSLAVIVMTVPVTVMVITTLTSLRKSLFHRSVTLIILWGVLALFGIAAGYQDHYPGLDTRDRQEWFLTLSMQLMLIGLLILPWLQWRFEPSDGQTFYTAFFRRNGYNVFTLLMVVITNGLFWLILLLWAKLFGMLGITLFDSIFFESGWFFSVVTGAISSLVVMLMQHQTQRIAAIQNLLMLIARWLLPLISLLTLSFIMVLPFVGLETLSRQLSAAGLLNALALVSLILITAAFGPERNVRRYPAAVRYLISASVLILPLCAFLASWALWLRIHQYGWTPSRIYAVLITCITLVWSMGYSISLLFNRHDPLKMQDKVVPGIFLMMLIFLVLLRTPLLDVWKISIDDQMARYQSGTLSAEQIDLYMFSQAGYDGEQALKSLQQDEKFISNPQRRKHLTLLLAAPKKMPQSASPAQFKAFIEVMPAGIQPDQQFWETISREASYATNCLNNKDECLLVREDLNRDGQGEWVLFQFSEGMAVVFKRSDQMWMTAGHSRRFPKGLTKAELLNALAQNKVIPVKKQWDDIAIFGDHLKIDYFDTGLQ